ncbi:creatininase family protein [Variovorax sp. HJSM1_2]|uniref:creatininase family protein n=1 Tax=Variovorax sp. HJSM1_2 TaxID=3366263 RepID=UPI003BC2BC5E
MQFKSRFWAELGTRDFAHLDPARTVAVLPVAAIEQHGPHLPLCVDSALVDGVVAAALPHLPADLPALFLPTQQIGKSDEHIRFPGTLSLSVETLIRVWSDIGASVARAGVKKMVLFNSHGGQLSVMDIVARALRTEHDMIVYHCSWYSLPLGDAVDNLFPAHEQRFGIHAGAVETSMMLALRPDLVDMAQARNFHSSSQDRAARYPILGNGKSAKWGWHMQDYNPCGAAGDATLAKAEHGHSIVQAAGQQLAALLQEVADLPLSTLVDQPRLAD